MANINANATSKGVGTGTAVIDDYGTLNRATSNFYKNRRLDEDKNEAKKAAADKLAKAANDELEGKLGDYDPNKLRIVDRDATFNMYQEVRNKYRGKYGKMAKDPALANAYREDMARVKNFAANSKDSKAEFQNFTKAMAQVGSGYSLERQKLIRDTLSQTGYTIQDFKDSDLYARDQVIGDQFGRIVDLIGGGEENLYEVTKPLITDAQGNVTQRETKAWKEDNYKKFKTAIMNNPEAIQDMNLTIKDKYYFNTITFNVTFRTLPYIFKELRFFALDKILDFLHEFNYSP